MSPQKRTSGRWASGPKIGRIRFPNSTPVRSFFTNVYLNNNRTSDQCVYRTLCRSPICTKRLSRDRLFNTCVIIDYYPLHSDNLNRNLQGNQGFKGTSINYNIDEILSIFDPLHPLLTSYFISLYWTVDIWPLPHFLACQRNLWTSPNHVIISYERHKTNVMRPTSRVTHPMQRMWLILHWISSDF